MKIFINNRPCVLPEGLNLSRAVGERALPGIAAVWVNGKPVMREEYDTLTIHDGDRIKVHRITGEYDLVYRMYGEKHFGMRRRGEPDRFADAGADSGCAAPKEAERKNAVTTADTNRMAYAEYRSGKGWTKPIICQRRWLALEPACGAFLRNQFCTASVPAGRDREGSVLIFRAEETAAALQNECRRKEIPVPGEEFPADSIRSLAEAEKEQLSEESGSFLLLRILLTAAGTVRRPEFLMTVTAEVRPEPEREVRLFSLHSSAGYGAGVFCGPGEIPLLIGETDGGGIGCSDDSVFFITGNTVIAPPVPLGGPFYSDLMRDSVLQLLTREGLSVRERLPEPEEYPGGGRSDSIDEIFVAGIRNGIRRVTEWEHFGGKMWKEKEDRKSRESVADRLRSKFDDILRGRAEDWFRWILYGSSRHGKRR